MYLLKVRSIPVGAQVLIDGEPMGQTPFQRRILDVDKPHVLGVRKPGFELYERGVTPGDAWIKDGNTETLSVSAKLKKSKSQSPAPAVAPEAQPEPAPEQPKKL